MYAKQKHPECKKVLGQKEAALPSLANIQLSLQMDSAKNRVHFQPQANQSRSTRTRLESDLPCIINHVSCYL